MAPGETVTRLEAPLTTKSDTRSMLAHAREQAERHALSDYFVVDVGARRDPSRSWRDVVTRYEDEIMTFNGLNQLGAVARSPMARNQLQYVNDLFSYGYNDHDLFGRIPHHGPGLEEVDDESVPRVVELCRRAMDELGIDVQVVFPSNMVNLGRSPLPGGEAQVALAYNQWFSEEICTREDRIKFFAYLPVRRPEMCERIVELMSGRPGVCGFVITTLRYEHLYENRYASIFARIEELGYPLAFLGSPSWEEPWMRTMNQIASIDAVTPPFANSVHLSNWVINGMPERFPSLHTLWIGGGIAWIPFLMQRLDSNYLKRSSEAPLLRRLPSEYICEMYFASQPIEREHPRLLEAALESFGAESQLLYASGWPQWDFDPPAVICELPFLSPDARRAILGENARRLLSL